MEEMIQGYLEMGALNLALAEDFAPLEAEGSKAAGWEE